MGSDYAKSGSVLFAGFWARVAAYFVDCAIIVIIGLVITIGSTFAGEDGVLIGSIANLLINLLYWPVLESSSRQATFGKSIVGIQVSDLNGNRLSFLRALMRNLAKIISAIPLCIGFLLAAFTGRKQALHDIITDSLVIRSRPSSFFKSLAVAVGGLVIAVGASGAYLYFNYQPQFEKELTVAMEEAMKYQAEAQPANAPAVRPAVPRPPTVSAVAVAAPVAPVMPVASSVPTTPVAVPAHPAVPDKVAVAVTSQPLKPLLEPASEPEQAKPAVKVSKPKTPKVDAPEIKATRIKTHRIKTARIKTPPVRQVMTDSEPSTPEPSAPIRMVPVSDAPQQSTPLPDVPVPGTPEQSVAEPSQQATPLLPQVIPESSAVVVSELGPSVATPRYNDILTAVLRSDEAGVLQLLNLGRWIDKPGASGMTPLMGAVMNRDAKMVKLLLEHGADPGAYALHQARKNKDAETVMLLEQHGAR